MLFCMWTTFTKIVKRIHKENCSGPSVNFVSPTSEINCVLAKLLKVVKEARRLRSSNTKIVLLKHKFHKNYFVHQRMVSNFVSKIHCYLNENFHTISVNLMNLFVHELWREKFTQTRKGSSDISENNFDESANFRCLISRSHSVPFSIGDD